LLAKIAKPHAQRKSTALVCQIITYCVDQAGRGWANNPLSTDRRRSQCDSGRAKDAGLYQVDSTRSTSTSVHPCLYRHDHESLDDEPVAASPLVRAAQEFQAHETKVDQAVQRAGRFSVNAKTSRMPAKVHAYACDATLGLAPVRIEKYVRTRPEPSLQSQSGTG
jgi:hypothetical protein